MKQIEWHVRNHHLPDGSMIVIAAPKVDDMLEDPFGRKIFNKFWPYAMMDELAGSALLKSIKSQAPETVVLPPSGAISETATPLGDGRFVVEYEVEE